MNATVVQLPTVESLSDEIRGLVYERQTLRTVGAGAEELERNRVELDFDKLDAYGLPGVKTFY